MRKQKIAVLTGVTSGIGKEVALGLVKLNYELFIIARNEKKFELLKRKALTIDKMASLHFYQADLCLVKSTSSVLARIKRDVACIDLLYQSAGLIPGKIELTQEGIEKTFAVSYLTRYLILKALLPLVIESNEKMILNMAGAGQNGRINFEDINFQNTKFSPIKVVKQFQQANDAMILDIHNKYKSDGLKVYCLRPGLVDTGIHDGWPKYLRFFITKVFGAFFMVSADKAAKIPLSIVDGTIKTDGVLINEKGKTVKPSKLLSGTDYQNQVIQISEQLLKPLI
ncbi:SDR family NAD(P)-dependent oxidoreductase [Winogradskyella sp.]|uniref:SDR family NAD(P)-dependent oxidoreductase n=1 Tax=Winogradskyella sp. TaxID=1883156 RepID=UPI003BAD2A76